MTPNWSRHHKADDLIAARGLTLTEVLISVSLVGILTAIAVPNYMNAIKSTRQKDVANQIANILTSISAYREEFLASPTSWDALSRVSAVSTNNGSAKGTSFTPISSPNGGYYTITVSTSNNLISLTATPQASTSAAWNIKSCLNTQTGLSDINLGNGTTPAAMPVCT